MLLSKCKELRVLHSLKERLLFHTFAGRDVKDKCKCDDVISNTNWRLCAH